jgi:hypothetical protein
VAAGDDPLIADGDGIFAEHSGCRLIVHGVAAVPFCACENVLEARENIDDWRAIPVEIRSNLCLFVPTKSSAIARKFVKRFGVPDGI